MIESFTNYRATIGQPGAKGISVIVLIEPDSVVFSHRSFLVPVSRELFSDASTPRELVESILSDSRTNIGGELRTFKKIENLK